MELNNLAIQFWTEIILFTLTLITGLIFAWQTTIPMWSKVVFTIFHASASMSLMKHYIYTKWALIKGMNTEIEE